MPPSGSKAHTSHCKSMPYAMPGEYCKIVPGLDVNGTLRERLPSNGGARNRPTADKRALLDKARYVWPSGVVMC
jgi:hypothetical protein